MFDMLRQATPGNERARLFLWLGLAVSLASGCVRARAKAIPDAPALEMPAPPPREIGAIGTDVPQLVPLPEEPQHPRVPRPAPPKPEAPKAEAGKPDTPKPELQTPSEPPKAIEEPAKPPTILQTTPAVEQTAIERTIRSTLARAAADLNRVDYRALNADARTQYDTAKRFIQQADDAIRAKNLVLARNLADKAATIAAQQAGR